MEKKIDSPDMFFIIGMGRSGTSLLQELMNTFEGFDHLGESRITPDGMTCYADILAREDFTSLEAYIALRWRSEFFIEKTPESILCLPQLAHRYPSARYMFLERDPLKVLLSVLNFFPPGARDADKRSYDLRLGKATPDETALDYEVYYALQARKMAEKQRSGKGLFRDRLTVRYEELLKNPDSVLSDLGKRFSIKPDLARARGILERPSYSSRQNTYATTGLTHPTARRLINETCALWDYPPIEARP